MSGLGLLNSGFQFLGKDSGIFRKSERVKLAHPRYHLLELGLGKDSNFALLRFAVFASFGNIAVVF